MNQLQEISRSTTAFREALPLKKDDPDMQKLSNLYATAGFSKASKLVRIAGNGYTFFTKQDIQDWLMSVAKQYEQDNPSGQVDFVEEHVYRDTVLRTPIKGSKDKERDIQNYPVYFDEPRIFATNNPQHVETPNNAIASVSLISVTNRKEEYYNDVGYYLRESREEQATFITQEKIEDYHHIPPVQVLEPIMKARNMNVFDSMVVLDVENRKATILDDPVVCGMINEMPDTYFYITAWDRNVDLLDIINQNFDVSKKTESDNQKLLS